MKHLVGDNIIIVRIWFVVQIEVNSLPEICKQSSLRLPGFLKPHSSAR